MFFLADENIASSAIHALRHAGHSVFDVKEEGRFGLADNAIVALAVRQQSIILTHDKDFLMQRRTPVLLLRFHDQHPQHIVRYLLPFIQSRFARKLTKGITIILSEQKVE